MTTSVLSGLVVWQVADGWTSVPLTWGRQGGSKHSFLLYSRHAVLPSLTLSGSSNTLLLAWDPALARINATSSSTPAPATDLRVQPLPPLTAYTMQLDCEDVGDEEGEGAVCDVRVSESRY